METATLLNELQVLGAFLQEHLQLQMPDIGPLQLQCIVQDGALVIMTQHPPNIGLDPEQTFSLLEQAILDVDAEKFSRQVKLYLRESGQKRPYAFHRFMIEPRLDASASELLDQITKQSAVEQESDEDISLPNPFSWVQETTQPENFSELKSYDDILPDETQVSDRYEQTQVSDRFGVKPETPKVNPWDQPLPHPDLLNDDLPSEPLYSEPLYNEPLSEDDYNSQAEPIINERRRSGPSLAVLGAGAGISLLFFIGGLYALSRPCVTGPCPSITKAEQLNNRTKEVLKRPQSGREILDAQKNLLQAIAILEPIPFWSNHHKKAQALSTVYKSQALQLDQLVKALSKAQQASDKSQQPPHSTAKWLEIQKLWREAIAGLEQVKKGSQVYPFTTGKLKAYKLNLAAVNKRLGSEQQTRRALNAAKEAAQMAEARQGVAQSVESWQLVYSTWQLAVKRLKQIPQGTTPYDEAQQLLPVYQSKLASVRDRNNQERFAANAYKQSLRIAQLANRSQTNNQWSQAVVHWRTSVNWLKQIPTGTYYYNKTQPLIASYSDALKQAQIQLQLATINQQARNDLKQTCTGIPLICTYSLGGNIIKVRLTAAYMQTVRQTALAAKARGDANAEAGVVNHVLTLEEALKTISENSRLRLEIYSPDGTIIKTHDPV